MIKWHRMVFKILKIFGDKISERKHEWFELEICFVSQSYTFDLNCHIISHFLQVRFTIKIMELDLNLLW